MPKQNTKPSDYPQAVIKQIELLAQNIGIARKRRHETQAQWAKKLGVSQPTMARIERGDPSVAMASYVMCMWLINQASGLADLISPQRDHASLEREITIARSSGARAGISPAEKRAPQFGSKTGAELAAQLGISPAEKLASQLRGKTAAELAAQLGISSAAARNTKTVAGLAALLAKAEPKSK
jgi:DNA-binding XRE family transcriptional regulator